MNTDNSSSCSDATSPPTKQTLRRGWTTGTCAAAAAVAGVHRLLGGSFQDPATVLLPGGQTPSFPLSRTDMDDSCAIAGVIKDAGDDPDITHGAEIIAHIKKNHPAAGITFAAGEGVGTVTLPGLPLPVGAPAINPVPQRIIADNLARAATTYGAMADFHVTLSIPNGAALATKTMNPRLGIQGGLSILGTTGIVVPYSCASWIHAIHRGIDVARAAGITHLLACTGSVSENAMRRREHFPEQAIIDMGDFVGGMLKYMRRSPPPHLTIAGGFAKIAKLAQGNADLHSARTALDMEKLSRTAHHGNASDEVVRRIKNAHTGLQALQEAQRADFPLSTIIARQAREVTQAMLPGPTIIRVMIFDRAGEFVAHSNPA